MTGRIFAFGVRRTFLPSQRLSRGRNRPGRIGDEREFATAENSVTSFPEPRPKAIKNPASAAKTATGLDSSIDRLATNAVLDQKRQSNVPRGAGVFQIFFATRMAMDWELRRNGRNATLCPGGLALGRIESRLNSRLRLNPDKLVHDLTALEYQ